MKIISLELFKYKRLKGSRIDKIKITPESKVQLILGTNGSGKSSLIKEMSPLPPTPSDYDKGGHKIIEIAHRNSHYLLKCYIGLNGNRFHFIKDGIDLMGDGGNSSVYKDLVKREFGITQDIHDFLTGLTKFTDMDTGKRRNWLTRFSDADYTYAIQFFMKLKEQHRDITGAIKLQQARLVQETNKLLQPDQEKQYREDLRVLNEVLTSFLEQKSPSRHLKTDVMRDISTVFNLILSSTKLIFNLRAKYLSGPYQFGSFDECDQAIIQSQTDTQVLQSKINELCVRLEENQKTIETLKSSNIKSFSDVDNVLNEISDQIEKQEKTLYFKEMKFAFPELSMKTLMRFYEEIGLIFVDIEPNQEGLYTRQKYLDSIDREKHLRVSLETLNKEHQATIAKKKELEHLKSHDQLQCPKCDHVWYRGFSEREYRKVLDILENNERLVRNIESELPVVSKYNEEAKVWIEHYVSFNKMVSVTEELKPFWDYVVQESYVFNNPRYVVQLLEQLKKDLSSHIRIEELNDKRKENLQLKILLSQNQETNLTKIHVETADMELKLYQLDTELKASKKRTIDIQESKKLLQLVQEASRLLEIQMANKDKSLEQLNILFQRDVLNEYIQLTQKEITYREQIISKVDIQKALVDSISTQISELSEKEEVLKVAVKELSPSEGLIAKGLIGFINHFSAQNNGFIRNVWTYPMEILAIEPSEDEAVDLDYKFPVNVYDDQPVPDISKLSNGQKEIINLAYRVVGMQYLDMHDFPVWLDEFGIALDAHHRKRAHDMIVNLLTTAEFPQIFMVSHYEEAYGSLANTDILVLCDKNIESNNGSIYNRHVVIS